MNFGIYILADGMGGHQSGEKASEATVRALSEYLINNMYIPYLTGTKEINNELMQECLLQGVDWARQSVLEKAPGGGTTVTSALIFGNLLTLAHLGDSRAYLVTLDGHIELLTHDHTLVRHLQDQGELTPEEAATHPHRNILYRALGQGIQTEPDLYKYWLYGFGYLLICSDGLWGVVSHDDIVNIIRSSTDPFHACELLVEMANQAGGPDNISIILVQFST